MQQRQPHCAGAQVRCIHARMILATLRAGRRHADAGADVMTLANDHAA